MVEFFYEYGLFSLKTLTLVVLAGALLTYTIAALSHPASPAKYELEIVKLNDRYREDRDALQVAFLDETSADFSRKQKKTEEKAKRKADKKSLKRKGGKNPGTDACLLKGSREMKHVFVLDFNGDVQASAVENLRHEVTALLAIATENDEVVVRLESGGGMVHSYGLAASQLSRITERKVHLTVCVDKIAASGGYLMACVADRICAAPFAIVGSIGVVAQLPNFSRLLEKHEVDFELLTAGRHKRTLTMLGKNTEEGRRKCQADLNTTHNLFKSFVSSKRPGLDIENAATGEIWYGTQAKELHLVDEVGTSDDYLANLIGESEVLELHYKKRKSLQERVMFSLEATSERVLSNLWHRASYERFYG